jgi:hypothetical protein
MKIVTTRRIKYFVFFQTCTKNISDISKPHGKLLDVINQAV